MKTVDHSLTKLGWRIVRRRTDKDGQTEKNDSAKQKSSHRVSRLGGSDDPLREHNGPPAGRRKRCSSEQALTPPLLLNITQLEGTTGSVRQERLEVDVPGFELLRPQLRLCSSSELHPAARRPCAGRPERRPGGCARC